MYDSSQRARPGLSAEPFLPRPWLRQGHVQTVLSRIKPRLTTVLEEPILIDGGPDYCDLAAVTERPRRVRLLGYYSPHRLPQAFDSTSAAATRSSSLSTPVKRRGLVLLLHGWEGCSHSTYNLALTAVLTQAGYDVLRLNLRDHGPHYHLNPYALNPGIFLGVLLDEAAHATAQIAAMAGEDPFFIVGASMGGNFALRLAAYHSDAPFANLRKVIAINPAIDPARSTDNVDAYPIYRRYFRELWLASLMAKARLFPALYDFADLATIPTIRGMTDHLVKHYRERFVNFPTVPPTAQPFMDADAYFAAYALSPTALQRLTVSTEIISALDDPIIDAETIYALQPHPLLSLQLHPTGGHVGYVNLLPLKHHLPQLVLRSLLASTT